MSSSPKSSWWDIAHRVFEGLDSAGITPDGDGVTRAVIHLNVEPDGDLVVRFEPYSRPEPQTESHIPYHVLKGLQQ